MNINLGVALWYVTNVIVPEAFSNKTPWFGLVVRVPALVVPLQRSQLCQLLLGEPFTNLRGVPLCALGSSLGPAGRPRVVSSRTLEDSTFVAQHCVLHDSAFHQKK